MGAGGSSGWQAPEQLVGRSGGAARLTKALDVFSYGLLLHFCLTGGKHPFGESFERDANILMVRGPGRSGGGCVGGSGSRFTHILLVGGAGCFCWGVKQ